jgi:prepilin-type processing-associated H-X9-DG protein
LPVINQRIRAGCNRVPCASNLRQIGQAIFLYAKDHNGLCPAKLEDLIAATDLDPVVFVCPYTHDRPADPKKPLAPQFAQPGHCSYRYLTSGVRLADLSADTPMATEDPANHDNEGANVLFGDGHVEWFTIAGFRQLLATTRAATRSYGPLAR